MSEQDETVEVVETTETTPETAPEQKEEITFSEEQQKIIDNKIAGKAFEVREEKRKGAELQRQLDEAKANVPKEVRPDVVASGDIDDVDYETQRTQREAQIRTQAEFDARARFDAEAVQNAQQAEQQKQQQDFQDKTTKFYGTAAQFDIDQQALAVMDQTIASYGGLSPVVGEFVLGDEQGMLIYQHLSNHPEDIQTVNSMNPIAAAGFINEIKVKQTALNTKRTSSTPDPATRIDGGGPDPDGGKYPFSAGATFE